MAKTLPAKTHVGVPPGDLVTLVTETAPTSAGVVAPLAFSLAADGSAARFAIPRGKVLVVTDVIATIPRRAAAPGRYVAAICNTPCVNSRVPIEIDTAADGFQKTLSFTGGVVFTNQPQFETLASNPSEMAVWVYGYLQARK